MIRVLVYRALLSARLHPVQWLRYQEIPTSFFQECSRETIRGASTRFSGLVPSQRWNGEHTYFGWFKIPSPGIPDWHVDPFSGIRSNSRKKWWRIPTFDASQADIKCVWEASRFDWMIPFCERFVTGDPAELKKLNYWLSDWVRSNSSYRGANWMCAQETSVRLLHFLAGVEILSGHAHLQEGAIRFVENHLRRIAPSTSYALAQQNNHIVSEAVALYLGGAFLMRHGRRVGSRYHKSGLRILEETTPYLFEDDGTFSQYSTNYQRMVVDLLVFAEGCRRKYGLAPFSSLIYSTARKAVRWIESVLESNGQSVPNWGGNDGSRILVFDDTDYRDFSSSVAVGKGMFSSIVNSENRVFSSYCNWLGFPNLERGDSPQPVPRVATEVAKTFPRITSRNASVFLRMPEFRFRPSNSDALHVDLWVAGLNLLRDAGSYSYAQDLMSLCDYHGNSGHNVVRFDDNETMPLVGRFLFESWLTPAPLPWDSIPENSLAGAFQDAKGNYHARMVELEPGELRVSDFLSGSFRKAQLNWRLLPGEWALTRDGACLQNYRVEVRNFSGVADVRLTTSNESLYYMKSQEVPLLRTEVTKPTQLLTTFRFAK